MLREMDLLTCWEWYHEIKVVSYQKNLFPHYETGMYKYRIIHRQKAWRKKIVAIY